MCKERQVSISSIPPCLNCPVIHGALLLFSGERKETNSLQGLSNKLNTHKPVLHVEWVFTVLILQNKIRVLPVTSVLTPMS